MLWLTCRDFQVEFWSFFVRNCMKCEGIWINVWLMYMVNVQYFVQDLHRFQIGFLKISQFTVISPTICFILWNATFHAVLCSCMLTACWAVCCWIAMAQNEQEMPWASQQHLAHNSCWEKQTSHRLLFLCLFGIFTTWYEGVCDRFDCRQCCDSCAGIFKWIFDHFILKTVWKVMESGLTCNSHAQLMCRDIGV